MNGALLPLLLIAVAGALMAVQAPTNAILAKASGSPIVAALISFLVGTAALALFAGAGARPDAHALRAVPWYAWLGGLYGAFFVAIAAYAAPRVGIGVLLTAMVAGQLAAALLLDHFGLLGLPERPASLTRIAGIGLVLAGAMLVRRG